MTRWPAEWEPHEAVWIGFPGNAAEWPKGLAEAQREVAAFANAICDDGKGEQVILVCRSNLDAETASAMADSKVDVIVQPFGDIWLRDTGPIITVSESGLCANDFGFNGWGGKFNMPGDQDIGQRLASMRNIPVIKRDWILEGGAVDGDGQGWCVTTRQCVLNTNRNQELTAQDAERDLAASLGVSEICWLGEGLLADHTDGHVDNLARFVDAGILAIPKAADSVDPNAGIYEDAASRAKDAGLTVVRLPSAGRYEVDGDIAPASYMNFYIGNTVVAVPQYGAANDKAAVEAIAELFPDHKVMGLPSIALLRGGGSFHCISQQIPAL